MIPTTRPACRNAYTLNSRAKGSAHMGKTLVIPGLCLLAAVAAAAGCSLRPPAAQSVGQSATARTVAGPALTDPQRESVVAIRGLLEPVEKYYPHIAALRHELERKYRHGTGIAALQLSMLDYFLHSPGGFRPGPSSGPGAQPARTLEQVQASWRVWSAGAFIVKRAQRSMMGCTGRRSWPTMAHISRP